MEVHPDNPRFNNETRPPTPDGAFEFDNPFFRRNYLEGTTLRGGLDLLFTVLISLTPDNRETLVSSMQRNIDSSYIPLDTFSSGSILSDYYQEERRRQAPSQRDELTAERASLPLEGDVEMTKSIDLRASHNSTDVASATGDQPPVPLRDAPTHADGQEIMKRKDQPSPAVFTRGGNPSRSICTSSEQQHPSQEFSDLAVGTKDQDSPLAECRAAVARTSDSDFATENTSASHGEGNDTMDNPNFEALEKRKVQRLFDSDAPIFKKVDMIDLRNQITAAKSEASTDGQRFRSKTVTGRTVERAVMQGLDVSELQQFGNKQGRLEPCILYSSYQALIHSRHPGQAPCAMQICHKHQMEPQQQRSFADTMNTLETQRVALPWDEDYLWLRNTIMVVPLLPIDRIIALACGSMSGENGAQRRRSMIQHTVMLDLWRQLSRRSRSNTGIQCFAQDPAYTEVDKQVLSQYDVAVVNDPNGFIAVNDNSVVLSFCPDVPVRQIITDIARPAILVWDTVRSEKRTIKRWAKARGEQPPEAMAHGRKPPKAKFGAEELEACKTDPASSRVREMIAKDYHAISQWNHEFLGKFSVYIRVTSTATERLMDPQEVGLLPLEGYFDVD
ncbi:hypothetical protein DHEL01_v208980 [Diaporthe helianthi]|uniref:SRR1-like domain-containing protein n=1 Tax=Diaporthe helianthi TaxID=158607 RepID=A0A2P5HQU5_DIAHE|nr:hypothetical protein DHEL01_v208980 [Diaporthe helianthi]